MTETKLILFKLMVLTIVKMSGLAKKVVVEEAEFSQVVKCLRRPASMLVLFMVH